QVEFGIVWQVPAPVAPGAPQMPVQQSASLKQMSLVWPQNEIVDGAAQVLLFMSQLPLQQSPLLVQALPAVWQPLPSCAQVPLVQALGPLQHGVLPAVHACPSEMHWSVPHVPLTQSKLQQSMALAHVAPDVLHIGCVHRCVVASQLFEQHSASVEQFTPPALQLGPPPLMSSPAPALMSMPLPLFLLSWQPARARRPTARLICNARMPLLRPAIDRDTGAIWFFSETMWGEEGLRRYWFLPCPGAATPPERGPRVPEVSRFGPCASLSGPSPLPLRCKSCSA